MGMFDDIKVHKDIELPWVDGMGKTTPYHEDFSRWFQTKSLANDRSIYKIDENGKLWRMLHHDRWKIGWEPMSTSSDISFYTMNESNGHWDQWNTRFFMGQLMEIRYVGYDPKAQKETDEGTQ